MRNWEKNNIPPPTMYRTLQKNPTFVVSPEKMLWSHYCVSRMLHDLRYTGAYVGNFCEREGVGIKKNKWKDKSEWVIIPNNHPAIIDKELFDEISLLFPEKKKKPRISKDYPLKSKVFCGYCGKRMMFESDKKNAHYKCSFSTGVASTPCSKTRIVATEVRSKVLSLLKSKAEELTSQEKPGVENEVMIEPSDGVLQEIARLKGLRKSYYEKMLLGEISTNEFQKFKSEIDRELKEYSIYSKQVKQTTKEKRELKQKEENSISLAQQIIDAQELSIELAEKLVERVEIFPDLKINIVIFDGII